MTTTSRTSRYLLILFVTSLVTALHGVTQAQIATGIVSGFHASASVCGETRSLADRRTADGLLKRAREAVQEGNLELAEWYVARAEKLEVTYDSVFERFVDTPEKVRQAMAEYRANVPQPIDNQPQQIAALHKASGQIADSAKQQATSFLQQGRTALAGGDIDKAIGWYQSAIATGAKFKPTEYSPEALANALKAQGIDPVDLTQTSRVPAGEMVNAIATAPQATNPAPQIAPANTNPAPANAPSDELTEKRNLVARLLAQSELALDRGEVSLAEGFAMKAQKVNLPDHEYAPGASRPWMMLMTIGRHKGRAEASVGTVTKIPQAAANSRVVAAGPQPNLPSHVAQTTGQAAVPPVNALAQLSPNDAILTSEMLGGLPPINVQAPSSVTPPTLNPTIPSIVTPPSISAPTPNPLTQILPNSTPPIQAPNLNSNSITLPRIVTPGQPTPALNLPTPARTRPSATTSPQPDENDLLLDVAEALGDDSVIESPLNKEPKRRAPVVQNEPAPVRKNREVEEMRGTVEAMRLISDGERALRDQDLRRARALFLQAWNFEKELDGETRQRLQDYLLTPEEADPKSQPAPPRLLADEPRDSRTDQLSRAEQQKIRALINEMSRQQAAINAVRESDPMEAWKKLKTLRSTVADSDVEDTTRNRLTARVDRATADMEDFISANRSRIEAEQQNKNVIEEVERRRKQRLDNQQQLAELVEQFNDLMDEQRFPEAAIIAKKASELEPLHPTVQTMMWKSQVARQIASNMARTQQFAGDTARVMASVHEAAIPLTGEIEFPSKPVWGDLTKSRRLANEQTEKLSAAEMEIQKALKTQIDVKFVNQPISVVMDDLSKMTGINVFLDPEGLAAEGVTSETTVSLNLPKSISLRSALNLILDPLHLSYIPQNEVLRITSEQVRDGDVKTRVYNVADLVLPIPNFDPAQRMGLPAAMADGYRMAATVANGAGYNGGYRSVPYVLGSDEGSGAGGPKGALAQFGVGNSAPAAGIPLAPANIGGGFNPTAGVTGGAALADFDSLIELVQTTVAPETWEEVGGTGTVAPSTSNLSLVVAQTQEVHEKIVDLLAQLRRLQDLQVTIEVRFITLNDNFFERMGVDFDFQIDDNNRLSNQEVQNLDDDGPSITVGIDPVSRIPTVDLDVGFEQGSFATAVPAFGGFDAASAASVGFAILSDIEAFFVIEAAQGDTRTNVLQAPKVTLFNGQQAFISDSSQRPFVTSIIPVVGDFAAAYQPVITVLTEGTSLSVQAVVSQDRRFVRLTLVPFFSQIGEVDTFQFDGATNSNTGTSVLDPTDDQNTLINNASQNNVGTTVQLPTFSFTSVTTTVSVPDGGTILLGGIKRLTEGRNEQGVPMLSKLPYINRLFRNVGIGRETESLMMMVTPRIIISEEEEQKLGIALP